MLSLTDRIAILLKKRFWIVVLFFALLVVVVRLSTFFFSVLNWDESLYVLVADSWLKGNLPYTTVWDNKPPGIYVLFVSAFTILGRSVFSIRVIACIAVTATCCLLYLLGSRFQEKGEIIGLLAGIFYAVTSVTNGANSSNTDVFFVAFATAAFLLFLDRVILRTRDQAVRQPLNLLAIGLLLGLGFEIKYVVLFDFFVISLLLGVILLSRTRGNLARAGVLKSYLFLSFGFILPFALASLYFFSVGHFDEYAYANFASNRARTIDNSFSIWVPFKAIQSQIQSNFLIWLGAIAAPIYASIAKEVDREEQSIVLSMSIWFLLPLAGICVLFRTHLYDHYFVQIMPVMCVLAAYLATRLVLGYWRLGVNRARRGAFLLALLVGFVAYTQASSALALGAKSAYFRLIKGDKNWEDTPSVIADYLQQRISKDDYIYVSDYEPIIYFLTGSNIPTKYAFPPFLVQRADLLNITGVDPLKELAAILQKRPKYIIKRQDESNPYYVENTKKYFKSLNQILDEKYKLESSVKGVNIYRLKEG